MKNTIMKKAIATTLTALALTAAVSSTVPVFAASDYYLSDYEQPVDYMVITDSAVVYTEPDESSEVFGYLPYGNYVSVSADVYTDDGFAGWYLVNIESTSLAFIPSYCVDIATPDTDLRTVSVSKGYLALRTAPAYDDSNEIGELYTGDVVELTGSYSGNYAYVYSYKYDTYGYVNYNYIF